MDKSEKKKFFFFKRILLSVMSFKAYSTFNKEPLSKGIRYFFLLLLIITLVPFTYTAFNFWDDISEFKEWLNNNLPKMSIDKGVLYCEGEQPVKLVYKEFWNIIIDTNDEITRIDPELDVCFLLNSKKMTMKLYNNKQQSILIPEDFSVTFDRGTLDKYQKFGYVIILIFMGISIYPALVIKKSLEVIFFSFLFSTFFAVMCMIKKIPNPGKLKEFVTTGIYSLTLPIMIEILYGVSNYQFDYFIFIYYGIYFYYFIRVFKDVILKEPNLVDTVVN